MQFRRYDNVTEFYKRVESFLMTHEAEHCLLLGISSTLMKTDTYREPPYLACVEEDGQVVAVALRTPPHHLVLSMMNDLTAIDSIAADAYALYGSSIPGMVGPKAVSKVFAETWTRISGVAYRLNIQECVYKLTAVQPVRGVSGEMRPATPADRDLLVDWMVAFMDEALGGTTRQEAERNIDLRLEPSPIMRGLRVWWDGGKPVSFVGYGGQTPNGIRIGPVYTPPELRGHGYASACTAELSQELLDQGRTFCFLFTDLSNPTSNHIYQNIGYQPVAEFDEYRFGDAE